MWSEASTDTQSAAHALTSQAHTYAAQSPLRRACHLRRRRGRATGIRCAVHCHPVTSILTKQRDSRAAVAVAWRPQRQRPHWQPQWPQWWLGRRLGRRVGRRRGGEGCAWHTVYGRLPWRERPQRRRWNVALHGVGYGVGSRLGAGVWWRRLGRRSPDQREQRRSTPRSTPANHLQGLCRD